MDDYVVARTLKNANRSAYSVGWEELGVPFRSISAPLYYRAPRPSRLEYIRTLGETLLFSQLHIISLAMNTLLFALGAYLISRVMQKKQ